MAEQNNRRIAKAIIPPAVMDLIERAVRSIPHGTVVIIVQDSVVIQIEKHEKIRVCEPAQTYALQPLSDAEMNALRQHIKEGVASLKYGQITLVVKSGKVTQVEKTEKFRFSGVEGQYGDGI